MSKSTPLKAIRLKLLDLNCGDKNAVRVGSIENPMDVPAVLHAYRFGRKPTEEEAKQYGPQTICGPLLTPLKAIKTYCRDCSGESLKDVKECPCTSCPLYPYREGKNLAKRRAGAQPPHCRSFPKTSGQSGTFSTSKPQDDPEVVLTAEEGKP